MVRLIKSGDNASIFKVFPVYRHKSVGEKITSGENILFVILPSMFLTYLIIEILIVDV